MRHGTLQVKFFISKKKNGWKAIVRNCKRTMNEAFILFAHLTCKNVKDCVAKHAL